MRCGLLESRNGGFVLRNSKTNRIASMSKHPFRSLATLSLLGFLPLAAVGQDKLPSDDGTNTTTVVTTVAPSRASPLPVAVAPDHAGLKYDGRFEHQAGSAICAWPASAVTVKFRGTELVGNLGIGGNRVIVAVDGKPTKVLTGNPKETAPAAPTPQLYQLASGLPEGEHTVTLLKGTEASCGNVSFAGFQLPAGSEVLPVAVASRKIEVIGDSISAGYGNEAASQGEKFSPATQNAYWTYGAIAARAVGADYSCFAWSGKTMWPTNTLPELYGRALPRDPNSVWQGDARKPDVFLVNLCTNDFNRKEQPEEEAWVNAYHEFIARLRKAAPDATIYCAHGPMLTDSYPAGAQAATKSRKYVQRVVKEENERGDAKVHYLEFATQNPFVDGVGADWHPNIKTHRAMAAKFAAALKRDLGWESEKTE
jgi:lysophospholipase L1-like esterase